MELGLLNIFGINEACKIAIDTYQDIKLVLSPKYHENLEFKDEIYTIGGYSDGYKKVIIDITDICKKNYIEIKLKEIEEGYEF